VLTSSAPQPDFGVLLLAFTQRHLLLEPLLPTHPIDTVVADDMGLWRFGNPESLGYRRYLPLEGRGDLAQIAQCTEEASEVA